MTTQAEAADEGRVVLTGPDNWHEWIQYIRLKIEPSLWDCIDPDGPTSDLLEKPYRPQYSEFNDQGSNKYVDLTEGQASAYSEAFNQWKVMQEEYDAHAKEIWRAQVLIRGSVDATYEVLLQSAKDIRQWMEILRDAAAPSPGYMAATMMQKYTEVMNSYKGPKHFLTWLKVWQAIIITAAKWNVPQTQNGQWLRDMSVLLKPVSEFHAAIFDDAARDWDEEADRKRQNAQKALEFLAAHIKRSETQARTAQQGTMIHMNGNNRGSLSATVPIPALAPLGTAKGLGWTYSRVAKTLHEWGSQNKIGESSEKEVQPAKSPAVSKKQAAANALAAKQAATNGQAAKQTPAKQSANATPIKDAATPAAKGWAAKQNPPNSNQANKNKNAASRFDVETPQGQKQSSRMDPPRSDPPRWGDSRRASDDDRSHYGTSRTRELSRDREVHPQREALIERGVDRSTDRGRVQSLDRSVGRGVDRGVNRSVDRGVSGKKRPSDEPSPQAAKKANMQCPACGNPGHGLFSCWHLFEQRRPPDYVPNLFYIRKARQTVEKNPDLREKVRLMMKGRGEKDTFLDY